MHKLAEEIREILSLSLEELKKAQKVLEDWESKKSIYATSYFNEQLSEKKASVEAVTDRCKTAIDAAVNMYKNSVSDGNKLKGEDLTADAQLLSSGLALEKADLQAIFDRSKGNYTMQSLVMRYAEQHNINIDRMFFSTEQTHEAAERLGNYAKNALTRPEYMAIWSDEKQCEKIESPALI